MRLDSGTQSLIAGAIFDFVGYLTTRPRVVGVGASEQPSPVLDLLTEWAAERGLRLGDARVEDWSAAPGEVTVAALAGSRADAPRRIAGALIDFAEFVKVAETDDYEDALVRWSTKTGLEIHNPQERWSAVWWR